MEKIIWSEAFSLGNKKIDHDHKRLTDILNQLIIYVDKNGSREDLAEILSKLTDYVLIHFEKEERYMQNMAYPEYEEHQKIHEKYSYKVAMLNAGIVDTQYPDFEEIILFLRKWWTNHIRVTDRKYEDFKQKSNLNIVYR